MTKKDSPFKFIQLAGLLVLLHTNLAFCQSGKLKILNLKTSACDERTDIFRVQKRIISQKINNGSYELSMGLLTNCAGIYDVSAMMINDSLKIKYREGKLISDTAKNKKITSEVVQYTCDCYFEFTFTIGGLAKLPKVIQANDSVLQFHADKYKTYPIKFALKNGDTINYVDKYGFRQGNWYEQKPFEGYFSGFYIDDQLKSADSKEYFLPGRLKSQLNQTNFKTFRYESYFENGNLQAQTLSNDTMSFVSTNYHINGTLEKVVIESGYNRRYYEDKRFYADGHIKQIIGNNVHQDYYPNGILRKEFSFINEHDIAYRYYYDSGRLMATHYVKKLEKSKLVPNTNPNKAKVPFLREYWIEDASDVWEYFDKKGKSVTRQSLIKQGYNLSE